MNERFWRWYERHYALNVTVAAALFLLQIAHLVWLTGQVVVARLTGEALFTLEGLLRWPLVLVDYTEVPALLSVSLVYLNELRRHWAWRPVALLVLLNSQWLHIFWITDEFVAASFEESSTSALPGWLAWVAILIDYLEVPVMVDTAWRAVAALRRQGFWPQAEEALPLGADAEETLPARVASRSGDAENPADVQRDEQHGAPHCSRQAPLTQSVHGGRGPG